MLVSGPPTLLSEIIATYEAVSSALSPYDSGERIPEDLVLVHSGVEHLVTTAVAESALIFQGRARSYWLMLINEEWSGANVVAALRDYQRLIFPDGGNSPPTIFDLFERELDRHPALANRLRTELSGIQRSLEAYLERVRAGALAAGGVGGMERGETTGRTVDGAAFCYSLPDELTDSDIAALVGGLPEREQGALLDRLSQIVALGVGNSRLQVSATNLMAIVMASGPGERQASADHLYALLTTGLPEMGGLIVEVALQGSSNPPGTFKALYRFVAVVRTSGVTLHEKRLLEILQRIPPDRRAVELTRLSDRIPKKGGPGRGGTPQAGFPSASSGATSPTGGSVSRTGAASSIGPSELALPPPDPTRVLLIDAERAQPVLVDRMTDDRPVSGREIHPRVNPPGRAVSFRFLP
ncbi:MAG: hypothetical protein HYS22_01450 [Deltaproteobacteria bacterium]|nr:hypothetical protein [Deltaproteobacteria bacterium]